MAQIVFGIAGIEFEAELRSQKLGGGEAATAKRSLDDAGILAGADDGVILAMECGPDDAGNLATNAVEGLGCVAVGEDSFEDSVDPIEVVNLNADPGSEAWGGDYPVVTMDVEIGIGDEGALFGFAGGVAVN